jgi:hypothetical protein
MMTPSAGCATVRPSENRPMIDTKGVDPAQYEGDRDECETFARQISQEQSAANGAVAGAIVGLIVGAAFGLRNVNLGLIVAGGAANFNSIDSGTILFAPPRTDSGDGAAENRRDP